MILYAENAMNYANVVSMTSKEFEKPATPFADETPEQLISNIAQKNCRISYKKLFIYFAPKIKSFMMGQGVKANEAEDIAQDTMLKIWRKASLFDAKKAKASTWVFTIARNIRIDLIRKQTRQNRFSHEIQPDSYEDNIPQNMIAEQSAEQVKEAMKHLPPEQLQVLKLSFYEDFSHSQIAKSLAIPIGTVKSRLRLALSRLKALKTNIGEF